MERCAISGSSGFLGSRLTEALELSGHKVERLGRSGYIPRADYIYDLAAYGNMYDQTDYLQTYYANTTRVIESIRTAQKHPYRAFVYASSSSVMLPTKTYYSESKAATENFLQVYARETKKPIAIMRPFSITGVGEQPDHLIPKLLDSCMNGTEIPFIGEPVHDFIDVEDVVAAAITIAHKAPKTGEVYHVGSGHSHSNNEVREIVEGVTGNKANVRLVKSMRDYDTKDWQANLTRISTLDWQPQKSLEQSVKEMYERANTTNS